MLLKTAGNVGIGTTTPLAKLDIQGTQGQLFSVTDNLSGSIFAVADISGVPIFDVNSSGVSYFDGDVGIGTTSPISSLNITTTKAVALDTAAKFLTLGLTVDDLTAGDTAGGGGGIAFRSKNTNAGAQVVFGAIDAIKESANVSDFKGSLRFFTNQNSTGIPLERMRIDSTGNVGIGTTPIHKLTVNGKIGGLTFSDSFLQFTNGNAILKANDNVIIGYNSSLNVKQNGNVGIGTTSPDSLLNLEGSRNNAILTIGNSTNDSNWTTGDKLGAINFYSADSSGAGSGVKASLSYEVAAGTSSATNAMVFRTAGTTSGTNNTERMRITAAGGISFGSTGTAYGTSGQVLTSAGNASPTWTTPTTGTVTSITKGAGLVVAGSPITTTGSVAVEYAANVNNIITGGNNFIGDTAVLTDQILITDPGVTSTNRRVGNIELGDLPFLPFSGGTMTGAIIIPEYITHAGDTDTKFGFTAANQFQVIAGGNTNLNVQGNGVDLSYAGSTRLTTQTGGIAITGDLTVTADVGIGLTNPDVPLHVTANEDGSGIDKGAAKFINTNTGQGATTMHMVQTSSSNFANAVKFWQGSTPTAVGFIRLTTSATQFITSASDLNLKKNITNWSDDTLSKFKALEPKKFRFKTQDVSEDKTLGFIAQNEVDNFPEAYPQFLGDNEQPYYGFNPTGMVPHLMKAIKDLVEKVETLENRITQLENNN